MQVNLKQNGILCFHICQTVTNAEFTESYVQ